jgi:6-phosphogluconolactonase
MSTFVYVSNADGGSIHVLRLHADGAITPVQRVDVRGNVMPMAISPDRRILYIARRSEQIAAVAYSIDASTGKLAKLGEGPLQASMPYIATDRTGRWLLAASYPGALLSVSPIGDDRVPRAPQQTISGVPKAHCIRVDASNRFAFAASLGSDQVLQFRFDADNGRLEPNTPAAIRLPPGSGPRHLEFHPTLPVVYLLDELDARMHRFDFDRSAGTLTLQQTVASLPPGPPPAKVWGADLRTTPDGRFLYSTERGTSTLCGFRIDPANGALSVIGHWPTQEQPRGINVDPQGRFLLAVGQLSHQLGVYAIGADGALKPLAEYPMGLNPNWIEIVEFNG